jgi:hypothetical protein
VHGEEAGARPRCHEAESSRRRCHCVDGFA